jgi:hypothetical protein
MKAAPADASGLPPAPARVLHGHPPQLRFLKAHVKSLLPERGPVLPDDSAREAPGSRPNQYGSEKELAIDILNEVAKGNSEP